VTRNGRALETIQRLVRRQGPLPFSRFMEIALYDAGVGFFSAGGGAGRARGDFVTSPEIGPLFGACVARGLDRWWDADGRPDPFVVVEAGAGAGRLAREVLRAEPACLPALRYVLVERSPELRAAQRRLLRLEPADEVLGPVLTDADDDRFVVPGRGPIFGSLAELPARFDGVLVANELLDNLPFDIAARDGAGWHEVRVGAVDADLTEVPVPLGQPPFPFADAPVGARVPIPAGLDEWIDGAGRSLRHGRMLLVDYFVTADALLARGEGWLRTYRAHERGGAVLESPGDQDITADVVVEQVQRAATRSGLELASFRTQAEWLRDLGIDELVEEGRRAWSEGAARGDLAAVAGRSRVSEAAALTDARGLGSLGVIELTASG
jgi:SAM-dependent MidA family methyltransferase